MKLKHLLITISCVLGIALLFVRTDREFINLTITEGQAFRIPLTSTKTFDQEFTTSRENISKVSLRFVILQQHLPASSVSVQLLRDGQILTSQEIPTVFISQEGFTQIKISPTVQTQKHDRITIRVTVPEEISGKIALQLRERDKSFSGAGVNLLINGEMHENPAAYQVFSDYYAPLTIQLGSLLLIGAFYTAKPPRNKKDKSIYLIVYAITAAFLATLPATLLNAFSLKLLLTQAIILSISYLILKKQNVSSVGALFGAHILAFTTWFPLHILGNNTLIKKMHLKDIFFDPNQISVSHQAGSYIGFPAAIFAFLGILIATVLICKKQKNWKSLLSSLAVGLLGLTLTYLYTPHAIILSTAAVAYFAALGFDYLMGYLGRDKVIKIIFYSILILSLLDLWYVLATSIEYNILS